MANPVEKLENGAILALLLVVFALLGWAGYNAWKYFKGSGGGDSDSLLSSLWKSLFGDGSDFSSSDYTPEQAASMTALADNWTPPDQIDVNKALETANDDLNSPKSSVIDWVYDNRLF